ncbi:Non-specific serine/threonine protein kinase [Sulfidibacter corallicola]|uniref:Protein kinase n=1 Tax=Sulfidibacter corallicola TaxID=2818388 RepID=A0A8A4TCJ6_SULCO|nr:protein kinase [Sulfidibacter corallicola]QTD47656.1 protein kinase [Sulfidibacter corallicola]
MQTEQGHSGNRRHFNRITLRLSALCIIGDQRFPAQTVNFGPDGLSIITQDTLPLVHELSVICKLDEKRNVQFNVELRHRRPVTWKKQVFTKLGLRIRDTIPADFAMYEELTAAKAAEQERKKAASKDPGEVSLTQTLPPWLSVNGSADSSISADNSLEETIFQDRVAAPVMAEQGVGAKNTTISRYVGGAATTQGERTATGARGQGTASPVKEANGDSESQALNEGSSGPNDSLPPRIDQSSQDLTFDLTYNGSMDLTVNNLSPSEESDEDDGATGAGTDEVPDDERRQAKRVRLKITCMAKFDDGNYGGETEDFSAKGLCVVFGSDLPKNGPFRLKCRESAMEEFDLKVEEKHRRQVWIDGAFRLRVGLKILKYSPNFESFLERHKIAHGKSSMDDVDRALEAGLQLKLGSENRRRQRRAYIQIPILAGADERKFRCRSVEFGAKGLSILAPLDFPTSERFPLQCFGHEKLTFDLQVEEKSRNKVTTPYGKLWRIGMRITAASENFHTFLVKNGIFNRGDLPSHVQVIDKAIESGYGSLSAESLPERRAHDRIFTKLPVLVKVGDQVYRGRSHDFGTKGLCFFAPINFPESQFYLLKCQEADRKVFKLKVHEKNRKLINRPEGSFFRIGAKIIGASPEFQGFLHKQGLIEAPDDKKENGKDQEQDTGTPAASVTAEAKTTVKGRYRFIRKVGEGSFAEIYLVHDRERKIDAAMKVLKPKFAQKKRVRDQFIHEAQIVSKFRHPNIAQEFNTGDITPEEYPRYLDFPKQVMIHHPQRMVFYTMQFIKGWSLDRVLKKEGRLSQIRTLEIMRDVASGLKYAHNHDVVHLDIKPKNIMISEDGQVLITDFGLARILDYDSAGEDTNQPSVKLKNLTGTPYYMAPEQAGGGRIVDFRADIYSLGVTAYQMSMGIRPFQGNNWYDVVTKHLKEAPPLMRDKLPQINPNFEYFVLKCLKKNPENRFETAVEVAASIEDLIRYLQADLSDVQTETKAGLVQELTVQFGNAYKSVWNDEFAITEVRKLHLLFMRYFETWDRLDLGVSAIGLEFERALVYQEDQNDKSLSFKFYEDGVRNLSFFRGLLLNDLTAFMEGVVRYLKSGRPHGIDAVTLMFQLDLRRIRADYVDTVYEDDYTREHLLELENELRHEADWNPQALLAAEQIPFTDLEPVYLDIEERFAEMKLRRIREQLGRDADPIMRQEAIEICLQTISDESGGCLDDRQAHMVSALVENCVLENDFDRAIEVLAKLDRWRRDEGLIRPGVTDPRERLANEEFFRAISDKPEKELHKYREELHQITRWTEPEQTVTVLFHLFVEEEEEFRRRFLADLCLSAAGESEALKLVDWAGLLSDKVAMLLVPAFGQLPDEVDAKIFQRWLNHEGPKTRLELVRLLCQRNFPERKTILHGCASEEGELYAESRLEAWRALGHIAPGLQEETLKSYYTVPRFTALSDDERDMVFGLIERTRSFEGLAFLKQIITTKPAQDAQTLTLENQKHAAFLLKQAGTPDGLALIRKMSKKLIGNKELIRYCKKLMG